MADFHDPLTQEQEIQRAENARQILQDKLFTETWDEMEKALIDNIAQCPLEADGLRTKLCLSLSTLRKFRQIIESHMTTGKMALMQLEEQSRFQKLKRVVGL